MEVRSHIRGTESAAIGTHLAPPILGGLQDTDFEGITETELCRSDGTAQGCAGDELAEQPGFLASFRRHAHRPELYVTNETSTYFFPVWHRSNRGHYTHTVVTTFVLLHSDSRCTGPSHSPGALQPYYCNGLRHPNGSRGRSRDRILGRRDPRAGALQMVYSASTANPESFAYRIRNFVYSGLQRILVANHRAACT